MTVLIYGTPICVDTAKAQRFFSEHKMEWQLLNIRKGFSPADLEAIAAIVGLEKMIDRDKPRYAERGLEPIAPSGAKIESYLLEDPLLCRTPIIRFSPTQATVGWEPEKWEKWIAELHAGETNETKKSGKENRKAKQSEDTKHAGEATNREPAKGDAPTTEQPKAEPISDAGPARSSDPVF